MKFSIFFHLNSHKIFFYLFLFLLISQIFFWRFLEKNPQNNFDLVPSPPTKNLMSILSLGDEEFLFRALGLRLQNSGDVFAGFVALKNYDYQRIYGWMKALDSLNYQSNFIPSLASYYYSQTQNTKDSIYIINYLDEHASQDIDKKWWWMFQAVYIAKKNLKDDDLALKLAYKLSENKDPKAPFWTRQLPAFFHQEMGDNCLAFKIIENLIKEVESGDSKSKADDLNFMRHFINERLSSLQKQKFDPKKCQNKF
jgi:hypothetical protein